MSDLRCDISEEPKGLVMKVCGQMTFEEADDFNKFAKHVAERKPSLLVLDLSELRLITSAGLGALLRLQKTMTNAKCAIRLAALPAEIAQVLTLSRLTDVFKVAPTVAEALN